MIRLANGGDAAAIADIYGPAVESTVISFETEAPTALQMRHRIEETLRFYPWLVCEQHDRIAGYAYATAHRARAAYLWSVDTSVYVDAAFRRCGVGRGLYTSLLQIVTAQGHVNAYAGITLPNRASVALHEVVGFRPVGVFEQVGYKLGAWHDVGWWQLALQPRRPAPPLPSSITELQKDPSWPALLAAGLSCLRLTGDGAVP